MSVAVCDQKAFYPFRSLVNGPLTDLSELTKVERFVRTVVLHDEISMVLEPWPYDSYSEREFTEEEQRRGVRNVIVGIGPVLTGYDFFNDKLGVGEPMPDIMLSPALIEAARKYSNAEEGNVYYRAHIDYLRRIVGLVQKGGSALLAGEFGSAAIEASSKYPERLFENLDRDWQQFAREVDSGKIRFIVPPILSIILTRCARRNAITDVLKDLRYEWADARAKVWALLDQLKTVRTVRDMRKIKQELAAASLLMSPMQNAIDTRPLRVLWGLIAGSVAGAATAMISGGHPNIGAAIGAVGAASSSVPPLINELGPALFGRGAFDLARRVQHETLCGEYDALTRLLTDAEKRKLGL